MIKSKETFEHERLRREALGQTQSSGFLGMFDGGINKPSTEERLCNIEEKLDTLIRLLDKEDEVNAIKSLSK